MLAQFLLENLRFAINLGAALVFFAVFWLYFDSWLEKKELKVFLRFVGFLLMALSFLVSSTQVESTLIEIPEAFEKVRDLVDFAFVSTRMAGYLFIILSLLLDPILPRPKIKETGLAASALVLPVITPHLIYAYPILCAVVGILYLRRATIGLERHLKPVSFSFLILALSELGNIGRIFRGSENVDFFNFVAPFGVLWMIQKLLLLSAIVLLGKWVFGYLLKRFFTQLFMIFTAAILVIFLVSTVSFTFLLLNNLANETLNRLNTDASVLNYAIETKKGQELSDAQVVAQNSQVIGSLSTRQKLQGFLEGFLISKDQSFLWVVDADGKVLARGEDAERFGDTVSDNPLVKKALSGEVVTSVDTKDGVLAPQIVTIAASPIKSGNKILGAVLSGTIIDNAFVDGVKSATGLEVSAYGSNQLSATTLVSSDGKTRPLGVREENHEVNTRVLGASETFSGRVNIFNVSYLGAYIPLKEIDGKVVGMLFVGKPEVEVLKAASYSIQLTFIVAALLLVLSVIPSYLIAKYISRQVA